jgi:hypothetical protein
MKNSGWTRFNRQGCAAASSCSAGAFDDHLDGPRTVGLNVMRLGGPLPLLTYAFASCCSRLGHRFSNRSIT